MTNASTDTEVDEVEDGLVWEEPAPRGPRAKRINWEEILAPLEGHPGKWARIRRFPTVAKSTVAAGSLRKQFGENWEFASRTSEKGEGLLFARHLSE